MPMEVKLFAQTVPMGNPDQSPAFRGLSATPLGTSSAAYNSSQDFPELALGREGAEGKRQLE